MPRGKYFYAQIGRCTEQLAVSDVTLPILLHSKATIHAPNGWKVTYTLSGFAVFSK